MRTHRQVEQAAMQLRQQRRVVRGEQASQAGQRLQQLVHERAAGQAGRAHAGVGPGV
jgi:hypothetical protein